jgi:hypothetical protein
LPFRQFGFLFRQLHDVVGSVFERDKLATFRQRYRILEFALPVSLGPWSRACAESTARPEIQGCLEAAAQNLLAVD